MRRARATRPDLAKVRAGLRDFQLATVDYVAERMFDPVDPARRFLVADEVGLGKTFVARGLIAETIDRLWDSVPRIDIVYICSNQQIARQNIARLTVPGITEHAIAQRLTMLPKSANGLQYQKVNLIAFTPGDSLDVGNQPGQKSERVVLYWLLREKWGARLMRRQGAKEVLRGGAGVDSFRRALGSHAPSFDRSVKRHFFRALDGRPALRTEFEELSDSRAGGRVSGSPRARRMNKLIGELRHLLATSSIHSLEPDLIILDEFQRFSTILDGTDGAAQLARVLFTENAPRVLLLSATPYRMLTMRGDDPSEVDHLRDLMRTTRFLLGDDEARAVALEEDFGDLRRGLAQGTELPVLTDVQSRIEATLRSVMVRTERLGSTDDRQGMLRLVDRPPLIPTEADVRAFVGTEIISRQLRTGGVVDYWKSAPYLLTFLDGYHVRRNMDRTMRSNEPMIVNSIRGTTCALDPEAVSAYQPIDSGHPKLRELTSELDEAEAFSLLWMPPCLPAVELNGAYASAGARSFTKRLVFSSWTAVPRAVASMLSFEAERRSIGSSGTAYEARDARSMLRLAGRYGKPANMPVFTTLMPVPEVARLGDPSAYAERTGSALPVAREAFLSHVQQTVHERLVPHTRSARNSGAADLDWYWTALLLLDDHREWWSTTVAYESGGDEHERDGARRPWLAQHADRVRLAAQDLPGHVATLGPVPKDLDRVVALLAVSGLANSSFRALDAVAPGGDERQWSSEADYPSREHAVRDAAVYFSMPLRALFQQPEAEALVDRAHPEVTDYWRQVLAYCLDGGLPAVLIENAHMLLELGGLVGKPWDQALYGKDAAREWREDGLVAAFEKQVLLRATPIRVKGMRAKRTRLDVRTLALRHHFAVRFGNDRLDAASQDRAANVREAFNGPFWPFVLVSTSVGQEGLDFHPYCHAVVHWNLPHNPVDLEQREGRVHRYKGHAVRKNLASEYGRGDGVAGATDPWSLIFHRASADAKALGKSDLVPFWVFPVDGGAVIERHVPLLALSEDVQRYQDLVRTLGLYRLSFGQARQQDLMALLQSLYSEEDLAELVHTLRVDLSPR